MNTFQMIEKEVIDNFLSEQELKIIQTVFNDLRFAWGFVPFAPLSGERAQFCHEFWTPMGGWVTEHKELIRPFIDRFKPTAILRVKANLQPKSDGVYEDPLHWDMHTKSGLLDSTTSIFYVNTCNGYTYFEDGSKVESVANRMVTFSNRTKHAGTTCSDKPGRIVINFNYHKYYD
tara:strand:- start:185 stop:709 length:525 start_codon:yes stop_codon:yes gene_type:complete